MVRKPADEPRNHDTANGPRFGVPQKLRYLRNRRLTPNLFLFRSTSERELQSCTGHVDWEAIQPR